MNRLIGHATKNLVIAVGLALVMVTVLLWGADRYAQLTVAAQVPPLQQTQSLTDPPVPAWSTTQVFTIYYESTKTITWPIAPCNVTITLPKGLIGSDRVPESAIFTFTTEPAQAFPAPLTSIDYFFQLRGSTPKALSADTDPTAIEPQELSFRRGLSPTLEWRYQDSEIDPLSESTLQLYQDWGVFGAKAWKPQVGFVDTENNRALFALEQPDLFGFGGYKAQNHFPIVLRSFTPSASP
jgi:hypothetical protein